MFRLKITDSYSHLFGEQILKYEYAEIYNEIKKILTKTIIKPTKISKEQGREGLLLFSGPDFNVPIGEILSQKGWLKRKVYYPNQHRFFIDVDYCKKRVGCELQFGKYAFVQHDIYKFLYLFSAGKTDAIDVGIEVIPSATLARKMYSGVAVFDSVITAVKGHARNEPAMPIWFVGIDIEQISSKK